MRWFIGGIAIAILFVIVSAWVPAAAIGAILLAYKIGGGKSARKIYRFALLSMYMIGTLAATSMEYYPQPSTAWISGMWAAVGLNSLEGVGLSEMLMMLALWIQMVSQVALPLASNTIAAWLALMLSPLSALASMAGIGVFFRFLLLQAPVTWWWWRNGGWAVFYKTRPGSEKTKKGVKHEEENEKEKIKEDEASAGLAVPGNQVSVPGAQEGGAAVILNFYQSSGAVVTDGHSGMIRADGGYTPAIMPGVQHRHHNDEDSLRESQEQAPVPTRPVAPSPIDSDTQTKQQEEELRHEVPGSQSEVPEQEKSSQEEPAPESEDLQSQKDDGSDIGEDEVGVDESTSESVVEETTEEKEVEPSQEPVVPEPKKRRALTAINALIAILSTITKGIARAVIVIVATGAKALSGLKNKKKRKVAVVEEPDYDEESVLEDAANSGIVASDLDEDKEETVHTLLVFPDSNEPVVKDIKRRDNIAVVNREVSLDAAADYCESVSKETPIDVCIISEQAYVSKTAKDRDGILQSDWAGAFLSQLERIRMALSDRETKIVLLLVPNRRQDKQFINKIISMGVYDIMYLKQIAVADIDTMLYARKTPYSVAVAEIK